MCGCILKDDISTILNDLIDTRPKECSKPACTNALEYEMRQINERVVKSIVKQKQKMYYINWMYVRACARHSLKHSKTALIDTLNDRVSLCNTDELCKCTSIARIYIFLIFLLFFYSVAHKPNVERRWQRSVFVRCSKFTETKTMRLVSASL